MTRYAFWLLRTLFVALAVTGSASAFAADGDSGAGADTTGNSSKQDWVADPWVDPDALELNVYGLSYHPDREAVHRLRLDNQVNPGLGLHYELAGDAQGSTFAEVGVYDDSGRHWATFAALGYQFKLGESWRLGGAAALFNSQTYNHGAAFIAMIPLITYDFGPFKLNAVYFPKFGEYNKVEAYGFYLGIPFGRRGS